MTALKQKLSSLCVLRDLLKDEVITALLRFFEDPTSAAYCEFVYRLYNANGGNLSEYLKKICGNSENIYVKITGEGKKAPEFIYDALCEDLKILQSVAKLTPERLISEINYDGNLPLFETAEIDLLGDYLYRAENIHKYGYGIYADNPMFYINDGGEITPVANPDGIKLSDLVDYERERGIIIDNTKALLAGKPAANILLSGDAGTGKSSTVKAVGNALFSQGLRIIEVRKERIYAIPKILNDLSRNPLKFIIFIDDLSFAEHDDNFNTLKAILEGSVSAKSKNVVIYATSNRRHIVKESFSDREGDDVHRNDTMEELRSLSERFGVHVSFFKPDKNTYLHIVLHLAREQGIDMPQEELFAAAERMALERGGRSARLARQFTDSLLSK